MSHITGGGLPGNIMRTLGSHLNARVNRKAWSVPPIFSFLQGHGQVSDDEMMRVFNMGIGMTFIVSIDDIGAVKDALKDLTDVYEIGSVVNSENKVILK